MPFSSYVGSFGSLLAFCLQLSPLPAIITGLKEKEIKSLTSTYFIMGIVQSTFWGGYGYSISDNFILIVNTIGIILFAVYMNCIFYINNQTKNYIIVNIPLTVLYMFTLFVLNGTLSLFIAVILSCAWQSSTVITLREALAKKDAKFVNILLCYISFVNFSVWIIYAFLIKTFLMAFQNVVCSVFMAMNIYVYYWANGIIQNDNDSIILMMKKLFRVEEMEIRKEDFLISGV